MNPWAASRLFRGLVYTILILAVLLLLQQLKPVLLQVYGFLKAVLAPFIIAMIISYVLNPVVTLLAERRVHAALIENRPEIDWVWVPRQQP